MAVDSEKEKQQEVLLALDDSLLYNVKHPLQHKWTLWYDSQQKKANQSNWHDNLKCIITIDSVEDFWGVYNNVIKATQLVAGSNFHFFRQGVQPMWEDDFNAKGGKWVVPVSKQKKKELDTMWLNTVSANSLIGSRLAHINDLKLLAVIGGAFDDADEICGAVVSVRRVQERLSLWTKSIAAESCQRIGVQWKAALALPSEEIIGFQAHSDALQHNSSYSNKDLYNA